MTFTRRLFTTGYLGTTAAYGAIRKILLTRDAKIEYYDQETQTFSRQDMLLSSRAALVALGAGCSIYIWPLYLAWDLQRLEIAGRGKRVSEYGYRQPKYEIEYLWY